MSHRVYATRADRDRAAKARNPDGFRARYRRWAARNAERIADYTAERRATLHGVHVERVYRAVVWDRDGGLCYLCGLPADPDNWHLEHKIPISKGGTHCYANVGVSHPHCNLVKYNREAPCPA